MSWENRFVMWCGIILIISGIVLAFFGKELAPQVILIGTATAGVGMGMGAMDKKVELIKKEEPKYEFLEVLSEEFGIDTKKRQKRLLNLGSEHWNTIIRALRKYPDHTNEVIECLLRARREGKLKEKLHLITIHWYPTSDET